MNGRSWLKLASVAAIALLIPRSTARQKAVAPAAQDKEAGDTAQVDESNTAVKDAKQ